MEIYNEMINDLLDSKKKNLELRESSLKGIFVDNLTEISADCIERVTNLIKQGDNLKIMAETKLNDLSSRSHTIFRINIETTKRIEGKNKIFYSQFNLVDLAGSENVSKAKTEGIRMKECSNINKSLLSLSMVIYKLSCNQKSFINYRDSKLTRLLQLALSGNSKTTIICTISQNSNCYQEALNTLNFGTKAKTIKTTIKINELIDEKTKILQENNQLKSKIKKLEDIVSEKNEIGLKSEKKNKPIDQSMLIDDNCVETPKIPKNDVLNNLEKEVSLLKKMLLSNNNTLNQTDEEDDTLLNYNTMQNTIANQGNYFGYSSTKMSSKKRNINENNEQNNTGFFKRCLTEKNMNQYNSSALNNMNSSFSQHKLFPQGNYDENDYKYKSNNMTNDYNMLAFENEELKKNIYETRSNFIEALKNKDNIIKNLNYNQNDIIEKCDKILMENEENFMNLKAQFDKSREESSEKEEEIKNFCEKLNNAENNFIILQEENSQLSKELNELFQNKSKSVNNNEQFNKLLLKNDELSTNLEKIDNNNKQEIAKSNDLLKVIEKLNEEKKNSKLYNDNINAELFSQKARLDMLEKSCELLNNDVNKYKNDINSYKNEIATNKDKLNVQKNEIIQNKIVFEKTNSENNKIKSEVEKLQKTNNEVYKKYEENASKLTKYEKGLYNESKFIELEKKIESQNLKILQLELNLNDHKQKLNKIEVKKVLNYRMLILRNMRGLSRILF